MQDKSLLDVHFHSSIILGSMLPLLYGVDLILPWGHRFWCQPPYICLIWRVKTQGQTLCLSQI